MSKRLARLIMMVALVLPLLAPAASVRAGDCDGSEHYIYDHGDCTDKTGDTFGVMEKAYDESYQQGVGMAQRSRSSLPAVGGRGGRPGFDTGVMARDLVHVMSFAPVSPSPAISTMASRLSQPADRADVKKRMARGLAEYSAYAVDHGLYRNFVPSGFVIFTEVAYLLSTGQHFSKRSEQDAFQFGIAQELAKNPRFATMSDRRKQVLNDTLVIYAVECMRAYADAKAHHDGNTLAAARRETAIAIRGVLDVDPRKTPLTELECFGSNGPVCSLVQWKASGGTRGINPITKMVNGWQQGNRMLGIP